MNNRLLIAGLAYCLFSSKPLLAKSEEDEGGIYGTGARPEIPDIIDMPERIDIPEIEDIVDTGDFEPTGLETPEPVELPASPTAPTGVE